ncbi:MAG: pyridoxamine 5'-phosphate oxidase family protein [Actinobacteria bacterium]|nr:pyridoxamine 5'-phosphate oxidase family protein [Actinomycetota bacterium]
MADKPMYHAGSRAIQDRFDSRRIADRLEQVTVHEELSEWDVHFIEHASMFFLATADADGWPDCSYKGGLPGFVDVLDDRTLAFPSYDGNGMFRSLGNIAITAKVGMLFIDFENPSRIRINGTATVHFEGDLVEHFDGAQAVVRVAVQRVFPNCPRYIHRMQLQDYSVYAPAPGHVPPQPDWKQSPDFRDALPGT